MRMLNFPSPYQQGERPYDIFKDRMAAISSISDGIRTIISNKYINKQNAMIAENIQNAIDEQKAIDLSNLITGPPPEEIYPDHLEDTIGQFVDMFTMKGREGMPSPMGGLPATGGLPAVGGATPTVAPTAEPMIQKTDLYQLYNVIKDLPTGQITWDNIYKKMTEKKPRFMGVTGPEEFVLNQMMGQVGDPRAKLASDINLSKLVKEAFYPEAEKPTEWDKKLDLFLQTDPTVGEVKKFVGGYVEPDKLSDFETKWNLLMQRDHTVEEEKKLMGAYIETGTKIGIQDILENIPEGFEISSFNMSTTGATSFSFKPVGTTTAWEFDTWDEAQEFLRTHPQEGFIGKIETEKGGFDVTFYKEGTTEGLKPITPSDIKYFEILLHGEEGYFGVKTPEEYAKAKDYIERTDKDFPIPPYLEIVESNLGRLLDDNNCVLNMDLYTEFYGYYKDELKGQPPKYLPPELIPVNKTGFWKNKIEYGSALADDYELDFEAMEKDGITEEEIMKKLQEIRER